MIIDEYLKQQKTFIIAEVGVNHEGDFGLAKEMTHAAIECDVDAVKYQNFNADYLVTKDLLPRPHLRHLYKSQYERFRSLEFSDEQYIELAQIVEKGGKVFMSTPSDPKGLDFIDGLSPVIKLGSDDFTNLQLVRHAVKKNKKMILSTGLATIDEIDKVLSEVPRKNLILLHCVSKYPTLAKDVNLMAIPFLRKRFNVNIGYSDHSIGTIACVSSICFGVCVIEKHFTLDKSKPGDHKLSADPVDMKRIVSEVRDLEKMLKGVVRKEPITDDYDYIWSRKSFVAMENIPRGVEIKEDMIFPLRPGAGIPPLEICKILGKRTLHEIGRGSKLSYDDFI